MFNSLLQQKIDWFIPAVETAAAIAKDIRLRMAHGEVKKPDDSPVTVADFSIQALMGYQMSLHCPDFGFIAEESSEFLRSNEGVKVLEKIIQALSPHIPNCTQEKVIKWIDFNRDKVSDRFVTLDPIDGTKGYLRGEHYAIAMALVNRGVIEAGILACPMVKDLDDPYGKGEGMVFAAVQGKGAYAKPLLAGHVWQPISVSKCHQFKDAVILRSLESAHTHTSKTKMFLDALGVKQPPVCIDSMTKYAFLACGLGDVFLRFPPKENKGYKEWIWDHAAAVVILEEAGGKITDLNGKKLNFNLGRKLADNTGIVAANAKLHAGAIEAVRKIIFKDAK